MSQAMTEDYCLAISAAAYPLAIQLLVVMHVDRHLQQLPGKFERRLVVRDRTGTVAADVEAGP